MPGDVFSKRIAVKLRARFLAPPCEPFGALENLVRNGYRRFHTFSITAVPDDFDDQMRKTRRMQISPHRSTEAFPTVVYT